MEDLTLNLLILSREKSRIKFIVYPNNQLNMTSYRGKCDRCGTIKPDVWMKVRTNQLGGEQKKEIWCINCITWN